jgi:hypothetical protein
MNMNITEHNIYDGYNAYRIMTTVKHIPTGKTLMFVSRETYKTESRAMNALNIRVIDEMNDFGDDFETIKHDIAIIETKI